MILRNLRHDPSADDSKILQDGQCTYNVIIRRFCATIFAAEKQKVLHVLSVCL